MFVIKIWIAICIIAPIIGISYAYYKYRTKEKEIKNKLGGEPETPEDYFKQIEIIFSECEVAKNDWYVKEEEKAHEYIENAHGSLMHGGGLGNILMAQTNTALTKKGRKSSIIFFIAFGIAAILFQIFFKNILVENGVNIFENGIIIKIGIIFICFGVLVLLVEFFMNKKYGRGGIYDAAGIFSYSGLYPLYCAYFEKAEIFEKRLKIIASPEHIDTYKKIDEDVRNDIIKAREYHDTLMNARSKADLRASVDSARIMLNFATKLILVSSLFAISVASVTSKAGKYEVTYTDGHKEIKDYDPR